MLLYCMNFINKKERFSSDDKRSIGNEKSPDKMSSSGSDPVLINNEGEPKELGNTMESFQRMAPLTGEYTE